jgi:hypothetical protein
MDNNIYRDAYTEEIEKEKRRKKKLLKPDKIFDGFKKSLKKSSKYKKNK